MAKLHSRFTRNPNPKPIRLTDRDYAILDELVLLDVANTQHLVDLFSKSPEEITQKVFHPRKEDTQVAAIRKRDRLLFDNEYTVRIPVPLDHEYFYDPIVRLISDKGIKALEQKFGYYFPKPARGTWERRALHMNRAEMYNHDLKITDVQVRTKVNARETNLPFRYGREIILNALSPSLKEKYPWQPGPNWKPAIIPISDTKTIKPDAFFQVGHKYFFLEVDRDTIPNMSPTNRKTVHSMIERYITLFKKDMHKKLYQIDNVRVLFLTTGGEEKIQSLFRMIQEEFNSVPDLFLFGNYYDWKESDPLTFEWTSPKGYTQTLLDSGGGAGE